MSTRNLSSRGESLALLVRQVEDLLDLGQVVDAIRQLPAPVVPFLIGHVRPQRSAAAHRWLPIWPEPARGITLIDEDLVADCQFQDRFHPHRANDCINLMQVGYYEIIPWPAAQVALPFCTLVPLTEESGDVPRALC